jgi:short-subunit dehydrogenase
LSGKHGVLSAFRKSNEREKVGYILNVGSTAAFQPLPVFASYGAGKSSVLNSRKPWQRNWKICNVTVTCLSPGLMKTGFFAVAVGDEAKGNYAMKARMGDA